MVTHGEPCGDTWQAMCVTHGMPCVNMHGNLEGYKRGVPIQFVGEAASFSSWEQQREGGGREERKRGKEKRKGGNERRKGGRKEKKKGEEERKRKRKRKECCVVSRPGRQRTRNCAARGRFPPTLVILHLGAT